MSELARVADPDQFLPDHIAGRMVRDPYEPASRLRRVSSVVVRATHDEEIAIGEVVEGEAAPVVPRARVHAALHAYLQAGALHPNVVRIPRYALDLCDEGRLRRRAMTGTGPR